MSEEWRLQAACRNVDLAVFFPTGNDYAHAEVVCGSCPVRAECVADALRVLDVEGYRGGTTGAERAQMVAARRTRKAVGEQLEADIRRLHGRGWSSERIARWLGLTRETVRRRVAQGRQDGAVA